MNSSIALTVLETAGLVRSVATAPEAEYAFRHGLLQETVYRSLLRQERQKLHLEVGQTIESSYSERTPELAPLLGGHFLRGGDEERALRYFTLAGEEARKRYANIEALEYYQTAIDLARELERPIEEAKLLRELGLTHEIVGDLEAARRDHKHALALGRELADLEIEWRALHDLGKVWAAQDYSEAGEKFRAALEVARKIGDQEAIARSLNRLGNWHINLGEAEESKRNHEEALEIFEQLDHQRGIAETLDFLGMTNMISGDVTRGTEYYDRAIPILRSIDDKQRLASAMTARVLRGGQSQSETVVGLPVPVDQISQELTAAMEMTRELGWKSGECFAIWMNAFALSAGGEYERALQAGEEAYTLSSEIQHVQWMAASCCALGRVLMEILNYEEAREHLERALELARETGSQHWHGVTTGTLVRVCAQQGDISRAETALAEFMKSAPGMKMIGDRLSWLAKSELLLVQREHQAAMEILDRLLREAPGYSKEQVIPRIHRTRALACAGLGDWEQAREQLESALGLTVKLGARSLAWRLHADLARVLAALGEPGLAQEHASQGRELVRTLLDNVSNADRRDQFRQRAEDFLARSVASEDGPTFP